MIICGLSSKKRIQDLSCLPEIHFELFRTRVEIEKISDRGYETINVTLERFVNVVDGVPIVTVVLSLSEATAPKMYKNTSNRIMFDFIN